jgi:hypothetical protein
MKIFGGTPSWSTRYKDQGIETIGRTPGTNSRQPCVMAPVGNHLSNLSIFIPELYKEPADVIKCICTLLMIEKEVSPFLVAETKIKKPTFDRIYLLMSCFCASL